MISQHCYYDVTTLPLSPVEYDVIANVIAMSRHWLFIFYKLQSMSRHR